MPKEIQLTRGLYALVDDDTYAELSKYKWHANVTSCGRVYAYRKFNSTKCESMHRRILGNPSGLDVDHINGNSLDNRKMNLRACTHAENLRNSKNSAASGTWFCKKTGRWMARINWNMKKVCLGRFQMQSEAMAAAMIARSRLNAGATIDDVVAMKGQIREMATGKI